MTLALSTRQNTRLCKEAAVVGDPFNGGQPREGVEVGPIQFIECSLLEQINTLGWSPTYIPNDEQIDQLCPKDDPVVFNLINPKFVSAVTHHVAKQIYDQAAQRKFVLTLGDDHAIALGTVSGIFEAYPDACVVSVDTHAATFMAVLLAAHPDSNGSNPCSTDRLVYIGLRDVDDGEKKILKDLGIKAFSMHHIDRFGIGRVIDIALDHVNPNRDRPIHLSFDVDALDPTVAPSTGTPVRGGLTFREGHSICEALAQTGSLVAMDVVEVNPALEDDKSALRTIQIGCPLACCALGENLL
ncbi:arginase [Hesseltinella vesiculosa]|uniref:Arginase n=1 Tax=Hesseltinella vesiculosa TaxID=101127 RepID=A0A1X2GWG6_9FUNG|nr:arginase [Hesseltinella vesiculosa]